MNRERIERLVRNNIVILLLISFALIMSFVSTRFLSTSNMINILAQISLYGIVASAMTVSIIGGEFDLSVSSLMGLVTILFADLTSKYGVVSAIAVCILVGFAAGLVNGFLVGVVKISAFVATLSTMLAQKGIALTYTSGKPISYSNDAVYNFANGSLLGMPVIVYFFLGCLLVTHYVLKYTKFGRNVYAVGGNYMVAKMAGINVVGYKIALFVVLGLATSIAGILMSARMSSGNALYGSDLTMSVVAGVVIGGTSLSGGKGSAMKTLWGMLLMGVLFNALLILEVQGNWQDVVKGIILVIVVSVDALLAQRKIKLVRI